MPLAFKPAGLGLDTLEILLATRVQIPQVGELPRAVQKERAQRIHPAFRLADRFGDQLASSLILVQGDLFLFDLLQQLLEGLAQASFLL